METLETPLDPSLRHTSLDRLIIMHASHTMQVTF